MPTTLLIIVATTVVCVSISRRYTIMDLKHKYNPDSTKGHLRDIASGLKIGEFYGGGDDAVLYLKDRHRYIKADDEDQLVKNLPRHLGGFWFFCTNKHPHRMVLKRSRYNNLLQHASNHKKLPKESFVGSC